MEVKVPAGKVGAVTCEMWGSAATDVERSSASKGKGKAVEVCSAASGERPSVSAAGCSAAL